MIDLDFDLHFQLTPNYPQEEWLTFFTKSSKENTEFPSEKLDQFLLDKLKSYPQEPQVYTLITFAQDWLIEWDKLERERAKIREKLRFQQEIRELDEKFKKGTPVT